LTTFGPLFVPAPFRDGVSDAAWLEAMLRVESALASALTKTGIVPASSAAAVAERCDPSLYDMNELCEAGRSAGNPVEPLVRALHARVGGDDARYVHYGATSQDVLDTAAMLLARGIRSLLDTELASAATACARLAEEHRATPMAARTLLQQAVPTTFGLKAAAWLLALLDARARLARVELPAQLGGAAGTLASYGERGLDVLRQFAAELELQEPLLPWHTDRSPVAELGAALDAAANAAAKIGLDVVLLAQTEVAEVSERGGGGSSTMPQKQNPVRAALARACARGVHAQASLLTSGDHELERAAGAWQAEWNALSSALALAGGAVSAIRECLEGLQVHAERMRANMTDGLLAEHRAFAEREGREAGDDPTAYLGSADAFVERALTRFRETR
jgi:3-carboxy-cis,cis-muconate cycloisomerase